MLPLIVLGLGASPLEAGLIAASSLIGIFPETTGQTLTDASRAQSPDTREVVEV